MRSRVVLLIFLCSVTGLACTSLLGDFTVNARLTDAGGSVEESGTDDAGALPPVVVTATVSDVALYLGQAASLDASNSTTTRGTLSFAWTIDAVPPGSQITGDALSGSRSATPSFLPDAAGIYTLHVSVSALGSSDTRAASVVVSLPQVLFAQGGSTGGPAGGRSDGGRQGSATYVLSDWKGGGAHPVVCPDVVSGASGPGADSAALAGRSYDFWEAPAGQPSKFAAFTWNDSDGGLSAHLWTGSVDSGCGQPPIDLGSARFGPGRPFGSSPHFKPDGSRFVVFDHDWHIVTYSTDPKDGPDATHDVAIYAVPPSQGSSVLDPTSISAIAARADGGRGYLFEPPRVEWTATGLAWAQPARDGWEVVTAKDVTGAPLSTYMTCTGVTPREIAWLADGTVIASYRDPSRDPQGLSSVGQSSENIYQLKPDAQQNCTHELQYTHVLPSALPSDAGAGAGVATDFSVSPDGTKLAYLQLDPSVEDASAWAGGIWPIPGGYVYVVPVAGGTPTRVSNEPAMVGPRWLAGGTALVFTRLDGVAVASGNPATSIVVMAADGGGPHAIASGDGVVTFVSTSGNAACNASAGGGWGGGAAYSSVASVAIVALGALGRRRGRGRGRGEGGSVRGHPRRRR
jgi:hypothetical protein